jgi:hypothetical protein
MDPANSAGCQGDEQEYTDTNNFQQKTVEEPHTFDKLLRLGNSPDFLTSFSVPDSLW